MGSGYVTELFVCAQNVPGRINQKLIKSRKWGQGKEEGFHVIPGLIFDSGTRRLHHLVIKIAK